MTPYSTLDSSNMPELMVIPAKAWKPQSSSQSNWIRCDSSVWFDAHACWGDFMPRRAYSHLSNALKSLVAITILPCQALHYLLESFLLQGFWSHIKFHWHRGLLQETSKDFTHLHYGKKHFVSSPGLDPIKMRSTCCLKGVLTLSLLPKVDLFVW